MCEQTDHLGVWHILLSGHMPQGEVLRSLLGILSQLLRADPVVAFPGTPAVKSPPLPPFPEEYTPMNEWLEKTRARLREQPGPRFKSHTSFT